MTLFDQVAEIGPDGIAYSWRQECDAKFDDHKQDDEDDDEVDDEEDEVSSTMSHRHSSVNRSSGAGADREDVGSEVGTRLGRGTRQAIDESRRPLRAGSDARACEPRADNGRKTAAANGSVVGRSGGECGGADSDAASGAARGGAVTTSRNHDDGHGQSRLLPSIDTGGRAAQGTGASPRNNAQRGDGHDRGHEHDRTSAAADRVAARLREESYQYANPTGGPTNWNTGKEDHGRMDGRDRETEDRREHNTRMKHGGWDIKVEYLDWGDREPPKSSPLTAPRRRKRVLQQNGSELQRNAPEMRSLFAAHGHRIPNMVPLGALSPIGRGSPYSSPRCSSWYTISNGTQADNKLSTSPNTARAKLPSQRLVWSVRSSGYGIKTATVPRLEPFSPRTLHPNERAHGGMDDCPRALRRPSPPPPRASRPLPAIRGQTTHTPRIMMTSSLAHPVENRLLQMGRASFGF